MSVMMSDVLIGRFNMLTTRDLGRGNALETWAGRCFVRLLHLKICQLPEL